MARLITPQTHRVAKARVRANYPKAYRTKFLKLDGDVVRSVHHIDYRSKGGVLKHLGSGDTPRAAWDAALAHMLAKALTE